MPDCTFNKTQRLLNAADFGQVFDNNRVKVANPSLLILAMPTHGNQSRLGIVVAKKNIATAVQRNRLKRVVRETFRQRQFKVPLDIVFLARKGAAGLCSKKLTQLLNKSWDRLDDRSQSLGVGDA